MRTSIQKRRFLFQGGFFILFIVAPVFDIFRLDLYAGHFYFLGQHWTLGLEAFQRGEIGTLQAISNLLTRGFLPIALIAAAFLSPILVWPPLAVSLGLGKVIRVRTSPLAKSVTM